uniref:Uncharacterized protein n=1 Tax=Arundo donax TaxID=35708 RepID=A0A0A9SMD7_ARUDO
MHTSTLQLKMQTSNAYIHTQAQNSDKR